MARVRAAAAVAADSLLCSYQSTRATGTTAEASSSQAPHVLELSTASYVAHGAGCVALARPSARRRRLLLRLRQRLRL